MTSRDRGILRDVAAGLVAMTCSTKPALIIEGRYCTDQAAGHRLTTAGLIAVGRVGDPDQIVPAVLTDAGLNELANREGRA